MTTNSIVIKKYLPLPNGSVSHPGESYNEKIEEDESIYGVKWVYKRRVERKDPEEVRRAQQQAGPSEKKRRVRDIDYLWYEEYKCHRAGEKQVRTDLTKGGVSGQARDLQKKSKKINCPGVLKLFCYIESPGVVEFQYQKEHNHPIGQLEDFQFLSLSKSTKLIIENRLRDGYRKRDAIVSIQRSFRKYIQSNLRVEVEGEGLDVSHHIIHRDQVVHDDEIYNIFKKIQEVAYKRSELQEDSVIVWLNELKNKGYDTHVGTDYQENFSFGFVSPWNKSNLLVSTSFCLDATHNTTNIKKGILYTIVVRNRVTGTGCPVAYFFTKDHSMLPLKHFLDFIKNTVGLQNPAKITIDVSNAELNAIRAIYPRTEVQWCLFHVARAWAKAIREQVKLGSFALNNIVHKKMMASLKAMMWERSKPEFTRKLREFMIEFAEYGAFLTYFQKHYLLDDRFKHWTASYQPAIFTNMETNNYVESWHNQLKTTYLGRKPNRRVDRLIWILVNDVEEDYQQNISRMLLNVGRMGPEERRRRKRELEAEAINENVITLMVELQQPGHYHVSSFTTSEIKYDVKVENGTMKSCSCPDFTWNQTACKHMFLLHRVDSTISIFEGKSM